MKRTQVDSNIDKGKLLPLAQMQSGQSGILAEILGGHGLVDHLNALGLRPGKKVTKISSMLMRGPVTIRMDRIEIAVGFGIARKIMVRLK
ncbi:MAG: FeoA family protein [Desulfobacterales bacterium]|jgi:ferrous iron transport protein A